MKRLILSSQLVILSGIFSISADAHSWFQHCGKYEAVGRADCGDKTNVCHLVFSKGETNETSVILKNLSPTIVKALGGFDSNFLFELRSLKAPLSVYYSGPSHPEPLASLDAPKDSFKLISESPCKK